LDLSKRLKLVVYDYEYRGVRVVFLKDYPGLPTPSGIISVKKGDEIEIPRWQARILEREGAVEVLEDPIDAKKIMMYHYQEKKRSQATTLAELPQDFYLKVRDYIRRIDEAVREDPRKVNYVLLRERENIERSLYDLAQTRLSKIVRLALSDGEEFRGRMTPEERLVYNQVYGASRAWRDYIRSIFRGEEQ